VGYASCKPADALVCLFVWGYFVYCAFFVCCFLYFLFVCTVTDFSAAEKGRGVKFCMGVAYYPDRSSPL